LSCLQTIIRLGGKDKKSWDKEINFPLAPARAKEETAFSPETQQYPALNTIARQRLTAAYFE
jgi:hypothetical protein